MRWSMATAYVGLALLGATLALGPLSVLRRRPNPVSTDLRRDVVERVRKGTRFTVIYRSRPAFQIVPVDDKGSAPNSLAEDTLYRAKAVGSSDDGRTSTDHDAILYPR